MKTFRYIIISLLISCSICGIGMCLTEYIKISGYSQSEYSYNKNDIIEFINNKAYAAEYECNKRQYKPEQDKLAGVTEQEAKIDVANARANGIKIEVDTVKVGETARVETEMSVTKTRQKRQLEVNKAQTKAAEDFYKSSITDYNSPYNRARRTYNLNTLRNMGTYGGYGYKYGHGY